MNVRQLSLHVVLILILFSSAVGAETICGKVIAVKDGDTIEVLRATQSYRIRLAHIDSPEKRQAFGEKAKQFTSSLCFGKRVTVNVTDKDRYGRYVGTVLMDNRDINRIIVQNGFAWWYTQYSDDQAYRELEQQARAENLGLWVDKHPIPPWEFRRNRRTGKQSKTR